MTKPADDYDSETSPANQATAGSSNYDQPPSDYDPDWDVDNVDNDDDAESSDGDRDDTQRNDRHDRVKRRDSASHGN